MALSHSPAIVTNGLVYYHDMGNTQKSWKGAPTTNLATTQTLVNHSLVTLPTFLDAPEKGAGWKKVIVTATSSNFRMLKMDVFNVAANSTTTYSIEFQCSNPEVYLNIDGTGFGGGAWTKIGPTRYSRTVTTATAGAAYLFVNSNNLNASVNYIIYYKEHQIESGSFATPYVVGTRSNTQAIVDLTGTNTVTATSLTYNSDNTFSFNGTSDYLTTSFATTSGQAVTYCGWLYSTETTAAYRNFVDSATVRPMIWWNTTGQIEFDAAYYTTTAVYRNQWVYVVLSKPAGSSSASYYVNGVLVGTGTAYTTPAVTPTWFNRAAGLTWKGNSSIVNVYNRALSAAEVLQNFNALKGRYGL